MTFEGTLVAAARIPDPRAHVINRCGHWPPLDHADELNRIVAGFVQHG
ncbi:MULTISPECIES: hypothetical protein [unclassified Nocardioides]|nr:MULTISPECIES: hypothetical protein [unclassified Nocardioides]